MLNGNNMLIMNPGVIVQKTDDELVVVLPDHGKYVVLNHTGAKILQMADGKRTLTAIATTIAAAFGTDQEQVLKDVIAFSKDMISRGILGVVEIGAD